MNRRWIAGFTALAVLVAGIIGCNTLKRDERENLVYAGTYRDGLLLEPTKTDGTGIAADTAFALSFKEGNELTASYLNEHLQFEPDIQYSIEVQSDKTLIVPAVPLEKNQVYRISIGDISWAFQTENEFTLIGSLPGNEATGVPLNSGIELYFSHPGAEVEEFFSIEPSVKGEFETHGSAVVFVPETLEPTTVYTVTLEAGLSLSGSDSTLNEEVVFSFETGYDTSLPYEESKGYFRYSSTVNEVAIGDLTQLLIYYGINDPQSTDLQVNTKVYAYDTSEDIKAAMMDYLNVPTWRSYGSSEQLSSTEGLKEVMDFDQTLEADKYNGVIKLPGEVPQGFYLVRSTWEDITFQTFLQVTDLSYYYFADEESSYYWLNDLQTKEAAAGAFLKGDPNNKSDVHGFLSVDREEEDNYVIDILTDGTNEVIHIVSVGQNYDIRYGDQSGDHYWRYLQTDRQLYQPTDTVEIFGFLQHRDTGDRLEEVTVEIGQQQWYYYSIWPGAQSEMPLVQKSVTLDEGFFTTALTLPNIAQGSYQIQVKNGENILATRYIEVENYVKPDYKIEVSSDKKAVFYDEAVTYSVTTSFFEGTPVSDLSVYYDAYGVNGDSGEGKTDDDGQLKVPYTAGYSEDFQGRIYGGFYARAVMPESGEVYGETNVKIFMNDIDVDLETTEEEGIGSIKAQVHNITLDRLNNGTAENDMDYLDQPVAGQVIKGTVYRNEWVKEETGEIYDYINKVNVPIYSYDLVTTAFKEIELVTDGDGKAETTLILPDELNVHYTLEAEVVDGNGHPMSFQNYFASDAWNYYPGDESLELNLDKDAYRVGDLVEASLTIGDQTAEGEKFLFIYGSRGLQATVWEDDATASIAYEEAFVPNVQVTGVIFTGKAYETAYSKDARLAYEDYRIHLDMTLDKAYYMPGDQVNLTVKALDESENPVADGVVNIAVVDEALYALSDMEVSTLENLYQWVSSGVTGFSGSHNPEGDNDIYPGGIRTLTLSGAVEKSDMFMNEAVSEEMALEGGGQVAVRSDFKDTALFKTVALNDEGEGSIAFTLPDNITAWRITGAAISESLQAGSETEALNVTLPFFINTNISDTYLVGDMPYIGVSGYGNDIDKDTVIHYEVTCKENGYTASAEGSAYENVAIPLFTMEEGDYHIQVTALTDQGLADGYEESVQVVRTYQEKRTSEIYDLKDGMTISTSDYGMTTITFTDQGKGNYLTDLYRLAYSGGKRVDQAWLAQLAIQQMEEAFDISVDREEVRLDSYITEDGGVALLPYGESDPEVTAKLAAYVTDTNMKNRIKSYLYQSYYGSSLDNRSMMLYGLATLGEPVLLEINQWQMVENLTMEDRLWLALAYSALGDDYMAKTIYETYFEENLEIYDTMARYSGVEGEEAQYAMTAKLMPLLGIASPEAAEKAKSYLYSRTSKEYLGNADMLNYVTKKLLTAMDTKPSLTYSYDGETYEVDFDGWFGRSITLPSTKMKDFSVVSHTGDLVLVADYNEAGEATGAKDDSVTVTRTYVDYGTGEEKKQFDQGDIVKVVIDWAVEDEAIDHGYTITDYAPSGLVPIKNAGQIGVRDDEYWYRDVDGQKVTFGVYKGLEEYEPMVYYARVVSPGTFTSDSAMIQGNQVLNSYNLSGRDEIHIEP